jgi:type I restriction enzyme S subunit
MSDLPNGWIETTLNQIAFPDRPRELPKDNPDLPFVGMENVEAHSMKLLGTVPAAQLKSSAVHFQPGDVLYGRLRPYLNKVLRAQIEGLCSAEFIVFSHRDEINSAWLAYLLNSSEFVRFASHLNTGDRPRVDFDQIGDYELLLAPRSEQDRIVAEIEKQLTRLDAATTALKRVQANLKHYRASVLKAACEGRLVPTEAELARKDGRDYEPADQLLQRILRERRTRWEADTLAKMIASGKPPKDDRWKQKYKEPLPPDPDFNFTIPEGWWIASMDQLTSHITSGSRDWSAFYGRGTGTFVMAQNVRPGRFDLSVKQAVDPPKDDASVYRCRIAMADLLVTIVGANTGDVCRIGEQLDEFYVCQSVALMRPVLTNLSTYLDTYMNSTEHGQLVYKRYTYGAGRPHLGFDHLKATPVLLPPEDEAARIAEHVTEILSRLEHVEASVEAQSLRIPVLRKSILSRAFSGELVPHNHSDEPASALLERIRVERTKAMTGQVRGGPRRTPELVEVG